MLYSVFSCNVWSSSVSSSAENNTSVALDYSPSCVETPSASGHSQSCVVRRPHKTACKTSASAGTAIFIESSGNRAKARSSQVTARFTKGVASSTEACRTLLAWREPFDNTHAKRSAATSGKTWQHVSRCECLGDIQAKSTTATEAVQCVRQLKNFCIAPNYFKFLIFLMKSSLKNKKL